jgi:hypothetical protein
MITCDWNRSRRPWCSWVVDPVLSSLLYRLVSLRCRNSLKGSSSQIRSVREWYHCKAVLRIRDVYPGSVFFPSRIRIFPIPDPFFSIRIRIFSIPDPHLRNKYFNPKKWFLSTQKYDPGWASRIRILIFYQSRIPDLGSKGQKDTGSRIRIRNMVAKVFVWAFTPTYVQAFLIWSWIFLRSSKLFPA